MIKHNQATLTENYSRENLDKFQRYTSLESLLTNSIFLCIAKVLQNTAITVHKTKEGRFLFKMHSEEVR